MILYNVQVICFHFAMSENLTFKNDQFWFLRSQQTQVIYLPENTVFLNFETCKETDENWPLKKVT